ncbi:hypothetical protein GMORB2_5115 [Geosmithia morbida]|uniref:Uncharacterized protein n=1 Tax=Geosmithia morbida TaxID=1094350 RepID=A0A9P4YZ49_9HYPO|nr:uncharacterized protein GMORB2_5115 [Geosmithia morbida]KAF4124449.1 hypothetical protein GMORB2_5115 [Geosmithia morbida]
MTLWTWKHIPWVGTVSTWAGAIVVTGLPCAVSRHAASSHVSGQLCVSWGRGDGPAAGSDASLAFILDIADAVFSNVPEIDMRLTSSSKAVRIHGAEQSCRLGGTSVSDESSVYSYS